MGAGQQFDSLLAAVLGGPVEGGGPAVRAALVHVGLRVPEQQLDHFRVVSERCMNQRGEGVAVGDLGGNSADSLRFSGRFSGFGSIFGAFFPIELATENRPPQSVAA